MRYNISLIGSYIIRGPEFINISSYFFILPLQVIKKEFYIIELRILWMRRIAYVVQKV
jgi:hypothetical protein